MTSYDPAAHTGTALVLDNIARDLGTKYHGIFSPETVAAVVHESYDLLALQSPDGAFLVISAERFARDRLLAAAQAEGAIAKGHPEVLFMCVHNSARSQMAAAFTHALSNGRVHVRSAGSQPAARIDTVIVQAMAEIGISMAEAFPKPMTDDVVRAADVIVTMGCGDACPIYPGKHYLDWELTDPAGLPLEDVRPIRDAINVHVSALLTDLLPQLVS
jgi:arsenate reductase (thioredoxin)